MAVCAQWSVLHETDKLACFQGQYRRDLLRTSSCTGTSRACRHRNGDSAEEGAEEDENGGGREHLSEVWSD